MEHRELAAQAFNATWDLLDAEPSPARDRDLLGCALTSRYHWQQVGGARELAVADWMVSRCFADLRAGELAVTYAEASHEHSADGFPAWLVASLHEGLARAYASSGALDARDAQVALAREVLATETEAEDREHIASQVEETAQMDRPSR
jgi:hypothetical protein